MQSGRQFTGLISTVPRFLIIGVLLIIAFVVLYYSYNFLFNNLGFPSGVLLVPGAIDASIPYNGSVPSVQLPYEGGDYTVSFWLYVNSNTFMSSQYRKHIVDIGGSYFSTVAIGIDGGSNSLIVRTHTGTVPPGGFNNGRTNASNPGGSNPSGSNPSGSGIGRESTNYTCGLFGSFQCTGMCAKGGNPCANNGDCQTLGDNCDQYTCGSRGTSKCTGVCAVSGSFCAVDTDCVRNGDSCRQAVWDNIGGSNPGSPPGGSNPGSPPGGSNPGSPPGGSNPGSKPGSDPGSPPGGSNPGSPPGGSNPGSPPRGSNPGGSPPQGFRNMENFQTGGTPDCAQTSTLYTADMNRLFETPVITSTADCSPSPQCDIAEFNLQRWTLVTVILSGKTTDVYLDGKLVRSCVAPSYYKVDNVNVAPNILKHKTFDGKIANLTMYPIALNPAQVYQNYMSGPKL